MEAPLSEVKTQAQNLLVNAVTWNVNNPDGERLTKYLGRVAFKTQDRLLFSNDWAGQIGDDMHRAAEIAIEIVAKHQPGSDVRLSLRNALRGAAKSGATPSRSFDALARGVLDGMNATAGVGASRPKLDLQQLTSNLLSANEFDERGVITAWVGPDRFDLMHYPEAMKLPILAAALENDLDLHLITDQEKSDLVAYVSTKSSTQFAQSVSQSSAIDYLDVVVRIADSVGVDLGPVVNSVSKIDETYYVRDDGRQLAAVANFAMREFLDTALTDPDALAIIATKAMNYPDYELSRLDAADLDLAGDMSKAFGFSPTTHMPEL